MRLDVPTKAGSDAGSRRDGVNRTLVLPAPAKLNLFLHVLGRRADGYHELQTLFRLIDLCDEVRLTLTDSAEVTLAAQSDGPRVDNLAVRAATVLLTGIDKICGVEIGLTKRIPQGGLGGGSSDAATVLVGLNHLLGQPLSIDQLAQLGAALGADVPVFVRGHSAWGEGVGEQLTPVTLPQEWYVVIAPGCEVATATVFAHPALTRNSPVSTMRDFFARRVRNDCESLVRQLYPAVDAALKWLSQYGDARLTGTGGCVFLQAAHQAEALALVADVPHVWRAWAVRGVDNSPLFAALEAS